MPTTPSIPTLPKTQTTVRLEREGQPESQWPALHIRAVSLRRKLSIIAAVEQAEGKGDHQTITTMMAAVGKLLSGWENFTTDDEQTMEEFGVEPDGNGIAILPFKPELLDAVIDEQELSSIFQAVVGKISEDARKNSGLP